MANQVITKALRAVKSPYNVNSVSQAIATTVLKEKDFLKNCEKEIILSAKYLKMEKQGNVEMEAQKSNMKNCSLSLGTDGIH